MRKFSVNTLSNLISRLWSMIAIYVFIPFYIRILGESAYGLVSFFATLNTVLNLLGLGLINTLRREFASGENDRDNSLRKYKLMRSVELLYFGIGSAIVLFCTLGSTFISNRWLNIEELDPVMVATVISLMGVSIALQLIANLYAGCLFGLERQVEASLLCVAWSVLKNLGALGVIALITPDLRLFYGWHIVVDLAYLALLRLFVIKHLGIKGGKNWEFTDMRCLGSIWKYTAGVLLISVIAMVNRQLDKVIISKFLTLTELGAYNAATTLGNLTNIIPGAVYIAIFPRFTKSVTTGSDKQLISDFKVTNRIVNVFIVCMMSFIGAFAVTLIRIWMDSEIYSELLRIVGCLTVLAVGLTEFQQIPYALALAHGNTKINVLVGGLFIPIVGVTTYFGIKYYGLVGAGVVYVAMALLQSLIYEFFIYRKYADENPVKMIIRDTVLPSLFALTAAFVSRYYIYRLTDSYLIQSVAAVLCGGITLILSLLIFSNKDIKTLALYLKRKRQ